MKIEFIIFFQKGLNPFKIQGRFKFEFVPEFVTWNLEGIWCCDKNKSYSVCIKLSLCKIWRILDIRKTSVLYFKVQKIENLGNLNWAGPAC
jgi:hypothetical protein